MAQSAAELRALVDAANKQVEDFQFLAMQAHDAAETAAAMYRAISTHQLMAGAAAAMDQAAARMDDGRVNSMQGPEDGRSYSAQI